MCWFTHWPEEGIRSLEARVLGGYELPVVGCWELNYGPLEEQHMLLTGRTFLQPLTFSPRCIIIVLLYSWYMCIYGQKHEWSLVLSMVWGEGLPDEYATGSRVASLL